MEKTVAVAIWIISLVVKNFHISLITQRALLVFKKVVAAWSDHVSSESKRTPRTLMVHLDLIALLLILMLIGVVSCL